MATARSTTNSDIHSQLNGYVTDYLTKHMYDAPLFPDPLLKCSLPYTCSSFFNCSCQLHPLKLVRIFR